MPVTEAVIH